MLSTPSVIPRRLSTDSQSAAYRNARTGNAGRMSAQPNEAPWSLEEVLRRQAGVFRLADVALWLTPDDVRREVVSGRWQRVGRGVYVAHNAPLTLEQERWACWLCAPPGSALSGLTAAELDGFEGFSVPETHLTVPQGSLRPRRDGLVVHYSTHLTSADVHPLRLPARTRLPRSLVDGASRSPAERPARAIILAGVQQRRVRPDDLRDALGRRGPCKHHALIVESIADAEGGIASVPEHDFDQIVRRYGLPRPDRQVVVRRKDGRYYLDADWERFDVSAEVHGTQHLQVLTWDADLDRHNVLTAGGRRILQFTSYAVRHRKADVANLISATLRSCGWRER